MKRRNKYTRKRTTFRALLIRALAVVLALTALFAVCFQMYLTRDVFSKALDAVTEEAEIIRGQIKKYHYLYADQTGDYRLRIDRWICAVCSDTFLVQPGTGLGIFEVPEICPEGSVNCHSCIVLVDDNGDVVASNHPVLRATFVYPEDDPALLADESSVAYWDRLYFCDPAALQVPDVDQFFARYLELAQDTEETVNYVTGTFTSAYVNRKSHSFIPHRGVLQKESWTRDELLKSAYPKNSTTEDYPVVINLNLPGYELVELHRQVETAYEFDEASGEYVLDLERYQKEQQYPYLGSYMLFLGESGEVLQEFEDLEAFRSFNGSGEYNSGDDIPGDSRMVARTIDYFDVGEEHYTLHVRMMIDCKDPILVEYFWKCCGLFTGIVTLLALLWCWRKNVRNQAIYAMEDYQRALTDNLAHDVKTPLMAISGYTENVLKGRLTEAERAEYLNAILDNVSYTDSLVSRTLQLNHMGEAKQGKPERIALEKLAAELLQKYEPLLGEKQITHSIDGSAAVEADPAAMETILENLISNAVKYTPAQGEIRITVEKKVLRVTNSVAQKLDVKKLKEPFVRGDAARSNVKGNGLGLALAEQAAKLNGFKLNLSCTDSKFTAELKM